MHGLFLIAKVDQSFTMNPLHIHDIADVNARAHLSISHPFSIENHCTGSDPVVHKNKIHFFHQPIQKTNPQFNQPLSQSIHKQMFLVHPISISKCFLNQEKSKNLFSFILFVYFSKKKDPNFSFLLISTNRLQYMPMNMWSIRCR